VLGPVTLTRAWYHCAECRHGLAPRDAELGVAGASMSPGLAAMNDLAAAAGPFAGAARLLEELAGIRLDARRVERAAEASGAAVAAALAVSPGGRVVLMGGVGAEPDLPLPYRWLMHGNITVRGQWMYSRTAIPHLIRMVRAGLIDLTEFDPDDANGAITHATATAGPLRHTVLRPDRAGAAR
jgi:alcohol dehydrogenase